MLLMLLMSTRTQTSLVKRHTLKAQISNHTSNKHIVISFDTDKDRSRGIVTLFRSPYYYRAIGKNKFQLTKNVLKLLEGRKINYTII